ncbi:uncharacterized protein FTOL_13526 [Fusarium torulosum]|uniref:Uncharacterized protein n=1 Tax=Fusarium torulosum TaxID=33205 RepID=A0AAE8MN62_9HYPO|nr:uncharacterized protein FTOL_13526 [Fusarium torulosum]
MPSPQVLFHGGMAGEGRTNLLISSGSHAGLRHSAASFTYENVPVAIVIKEIIQIHNDYIE